MKFGQKRWVGLAVVGMLTFGCGERDAEVVDEPGQLYWGESAQHRCEKYNRRWENQNEWKGGSGAICQFSGDAKAKAKSYAKFCGDVVIGRTAPRTAARRIKNTLCHEQFFNIYCGIKKPPKTKNFDGEKDRQKGNEITAIKPSEIQNNIDNFVARKNLQDVFKSACLIIADKKNLAENMKKVVALAKTKVENKLGDENDIKNEVTKKQKDYIDEKLNFGFKSIFKRKWKSFKSLVTRKLSRKKEKETIQEGFDSTEMDDIITTAMMQVLLQDGSNNNDSNARLTNEPGTVITIVAFSIWFALGLFEVATTGNMYVWFFLFYMMAMNGR